MINGAPTDNNAKLFKQGAHSVIDGSGYKVAKEYDTPDWSPDKAQQEMEQAITAVGKDGFVGVYAANDGTAGGAIAAMKGNGVDPTKIPTTGSGRRAGRDPADPRRRAVHDRLQGDQGRGRGGGASSPSTSPRAKTPPGADDKVDNGTKQVPSILLTPVAVTKDNINDTIVKDGFWTVDEICTGKYAAGCKAAGIQ